MSGLDIYGPRPTNVPYGPDGEFLSVQVEGLGVTIRGYTSGKMGFVAHMSIRECLALDAALQGSMRFAYECARG